MRRALVIGNTDGIGLGLTRRLLDEGWSVTGFSRRPGAVEHTNYAHVTVDVTAPQFAGSLELDAELCVYVAGVGESLDLADLAEQTRTIEVNLLGCARAVEAVVPRMIAAGHGHFIGISSLMDTLVSPEAPGYAASKAGMTTYLVSLAGALRPHGVAVSTVRFGFVDTKMAKSPSTPLKISVDHAVDVVARCVRSRAVVVSYPRRTALGAMILRPITRLQARLGRVRAEDTER